jgi:hypothetical protein
MVATRRLRWGFRLANRAVEPRVEVHAHAATRIPHGAADFRY